MSLVLFVSLGFSPTSQMHLKRLVSWTAMATAVGSKALTVKQAIIFGSICEFIGSLMGGSVCETITSGIAHPDSFASPLLYMKLMLAVLCGAFVWLAVATYLEVPPTLFSF
jgi:PiT family inorganic phosphate transporter